MRPPGYLLGCYHQGLSLWVSGLGKVDENQDLIIYGRGPNRVTFRYPHLVLIYQSDSRHEVDFSQGSENLTVYSFSGPKLYNTIRFKN